MNAAEAKAAVNLRKVVYPKPEILPACRNCTHFRCDHDDRCNSKGEVIFLQVNKRCARHSFSVQSGAVCDDHIFARADRSDR